MAKWLIGRFNSLMVGGSKPPAPFDLNEEYVEEDKDNQNDNVVAVAEVHQFPDFSSYFENNLEWEQRDEMLEWARSIGKSLNIVLVIKNSWTTKVVLGCVLGGSYKAGKKGIPRPIVRNIGIGDELNARHGCKKLGCPFELIGSRNRSTKMWHIKVGCGCHNHSLVDHVEGYAYAGRMTEEQKKVAKKLALSDVEPKKSMTYLKETWPDMTTKMKQLYDYRSQVFKDEMNGRGVSQFAVEYLEGKQYYVDYRTEEGSNTIQDIFFANPMSMRLLQAFPYVVVMDSTYKTNMYEMPLCEMVGFTCTGRTFCIALSFMTRETQNHYEWVLENLREVYKRIGKELEAIVTDRDLAEVNAVDSIFPRAKHMLCWVHIQRNCKAYALTKGFNQNAADWFANQAWGLFCSTTVREYESQLQRLRNCLNPVLFTYLQNNWLTPWRERIVSAFTDHRFNLMTRTNNRAESQHAALKNYIASSQGGFSTLVRKIHNELTIQVARVRGDLERDRTTVPLTIMRLVEPLRTVFSLLPTRVSSDCIDLLFKHVITAMDKNSRLSPICDDQWWTTARGIPCPHQVRECINQQRPIQLSWIHPFWKQLVCEGMPTSLPEIGDDDAEWEKMVTDYNAGTLPLHVRREVIQSYIRSKDTNRLEEPLCVKPKGRPNKKKPKCAPRDLTWLEHMQSQPRQRKRVGKGARSMPGQAFYSAPQKEDDVPEDVDDLAQMELGLVFPPTVVPGFAPNSTPPITSHFGGLDLTGSVPHFMMAYIAGVHDVPGDGHCGYRSLASQVGWSASDAYIQMRRELVQELRTHRALYEAMERMNFTRVDELIHNANWMDDYCPPQYWMETPAMGLVFATRFQCALVILSKNSSHTCFPLIGDEGVPTRVMGKVACIAHIVDHYVPVTLHDDAPMPPVIPFWTHGSAPNVRGYVAHYERR